jgi:predicted nucleic acid-binding protein
MALTAVLDACVLYPVSLRDVLLRLAEAELYQVVWSERILGEMKGAILGKRLDIEEQKIDNMIAGMRNAFPEAEFDGWQLLEEDMRNHDKDKHVLALAVRARADMLVTSNLKHFPPEACEPYCVEPIDPDEFLCQLLEGNEAEIRSVLEVLSQDMKNPPMSVGEILEAIHRSAPVFAERAAALF